MGFERDLDIALKTLLMGASRVVRDSEVCGRMKCMCGSTNGKNVISLLVIQLQKACFLHSPTEVTAWQSLPHIALETVVDFVLESTRQAWAVSK